MFQERLKSMRLEAKLTQKELAEKLKIGQNTYSYWEKGIRKPVGENLNKLANFFNVSTDYLLGNTDNRNASNIDDVLEKSLNTFKSFDGKPMSDHDREKIREILKEMFDNDED